MVKLFTPTAVALGNFDGVHRGHYHVIQPVLDFVRLRQRSAVPVRVAAGPVSGESVSGELASEEPASPMAPPNSYPLSCHTLLWQADIPMQRGDRPYSTIVTFYPHPQEFFSGQSRKLLTPPAEKLAQLAALGIEQWVLLPFDRELACLTPQAFVREILVGQLHSQHISVGADFRFGYQRAGTADDLRTIAAEMDIPTTIVTLQCADGERISSSRIRQALLAGDLTLANRLLGRCYQIQGNVITGQQIGRSLGFPTANVKVPEEKFLPRHGVYAVQVMATIAGEKLACPGVMNLGCRPTVDGSGQTIEVHLLGWQGNLYGQTLTIELVAFLRPEQKFASLAELQQQIQQDCRMAEKILAETGWKIRSVVQ